MWRAALGRAPPRVGRRRIGLPRPLNTCLLPDRSVQGAAAHARAGPAVPPGPLRGAALPCAAGAAVLPGRSVLVPHLCLLKANSGELQRGRGSQGGNADGWLNQAHPPACLAKPSKYGRLVHSDSLPDRFINSS